MVDMVTKEPKMYQMSGATEMAAQQSAQGKVQQYGYSASFPMIINLDGKATYFMTLKDRAGLIKQYAFVSVSNYTNVGTGETIDSALRNFRQVMGSSNDGIITGQNAKEAEGKVYRIASEALGESITYKLILKEKPDQIFTISYDLSNELALTEPGDRVKINYMAVSYTHLIEDNEAKAIVTDKGETYYAPEIVSAIGREGSDWFSHICDAHGIETRVGTVDIGVRVEVRDEIMEFLNKNLYEAKLVYYTPTFDDKVRTFCTNPSGEVATEYYENGLAVVNGHAYKSKEYKTNNTNFAILVSKDVYKRQPQILKLDVL